MGIKNGRKHYQEIKTGDKSVKGGKIEHDSYNFPKVYIRGNPDASGGRVIVLNATEKHVLLCYIL